MSNEPSYEKTGYALSSWNYGSFHHCNPYYQRREYLKSENHVQRQSSVNLNKFGKRPLKEEERIVSEEYLVVMKDLKTLKSLNRPNRNIRRNTNSMTNKENTDEKDHNYPTCPNSKVNKMKYQLSFEEWTAVKAKQKEISTKVKIIKESEDQNFESFNKKIDENYKLVQEQVFNEWLQKKNVERSQSRSRKQQEEEKKESTKQKKKEESYVKMELWLNRQAEVFEKEIQLKMEKKERENEEKVNKEKEEEEKRRRGHEAFISWVKNKKKEPKFSAYTDFRGRKHDEKKIPINSSFKRNKFPLGPYTGVKELRQIQMELMTEECNQQETKNEPTESYQPEMEQQYTKEEGIEDSLQELSSIKKDTPPQEQEADYD